MLAAATARAEGRFCAQPPSAPDAITEAKAVQGMAAAGTAPEGMTAEPGNLAGVAWLAGPGFGFGLGAASVAGLACAPPSVARPVLKQAVLAAERALGADADIAVLFTTHALACGNIYYVPLANDVRGIGYQHAHPREVFDDTPEQRLEGVAFLNDWPYWQPRLEELESALHHEIGHRWGARVHALIAGVASSALLGRGHDHWSYFLDSGGSPLEGNVWQETASGRVSATPYFATQFSALDRYLMGALAASEVPPFELLVEPRSAAEDCAGQALVAASPPQTCGALELQAEAVRVSIEDVIAAEGPRSPAASGSVRNVRVLVLTLQSRDEAWSAAECQLLGTSVRERLEAFERASAGRVRLENVMSNNLLTDIGSGAGVGCDELSRATGEFAARSATAAPPPTRLDASGCSVSPRAPGRPGWPLELSLAWMASWGGRRALRRRTCRGAAAGSDL